MRWLVLACCACAAPRPAAEPPEASACAPMLPILVERTEARLFQFLPAAEKFDAATRSIRNEHRVRPYLDERIGANPGGEAAYLVECRANVCRIDVNTRVARRDWNASVQLNPDMSIFARWSPEQWGGYLWVADTEDEKPATSTMRDCMKLETRLAQAEERLDAIRPLRERFRELRPSRERERIVSAQLAHVMDTAAFELECRGSICRIQTSVIKVRRIEQKKMFDRFETERIGVDGTAYVEMRDDVVARGEAFMSSLKLALAKQATRIAACRQAHWRRGMVVFELLVERDRVALNAVGENGESDFARCLRPIVEEVMPSVDGPLQLPGRPLRFWAH